MDVYYIDGQYVNADQAVIPVNDLALLRGYGVFDFLRTYGGRPFMLEEHLLRMERSAAQIGLSFPWPRQEIAAIVKETLKRNRHTEYNVRIVVTGGSSPDFITPQDQPRLLVMVTQLHAIPAWWYKTGVKVSTVPIERGLPGAKSINYIPAIMALREARRQGAVEAVYTSRQGHVLEGTTTSVFAFIQGNLVTPGDGILAGITREVVLDLARRHFQVEIRPILKDELKDAEEMFITASNKEIVPVIQVDDFAIGDGKPGKRTRRMMASFREFTSAFAAQELP